MDMKIAIIDDLLECRKDIGCCIYQFFKKYDTKETLYIEEFSSGEDF